MNWLRGMLRAWGVLAHFSVDEVINAEHEDDLRQLTNTASLVHVARAKREEGTRTLKIAIDRAKRASAWQDVDGFIGRTRKGKGNGI